MGKRLAAANGTPIDVTGEKRAKFMVKEGHELEWTFVAGKVQKDVQINWYYLRCLKLRPVHGMGRIHHQLQVA